MAHNQKSVANQIVKMDSRKFLGALNDSAQARVTFFSEKIEEMGRSAGRQWRLAALRPKDLFIEDVRTHGFYLAEHTKTQGKIAIHNIRAVEIIEGEKAGLFEESCRKLVKAIEENDQKDMAIAFNRMKAQRFSSRTVPTSGIVRTRDGIVRTISVSPSNAIPEDVKNRLVATIVESLQDKVIVENGTVTAGYFEDGQRFRLPVTKWATKKLVARQMREAASNAYYSQGFQKRIANVANFIAEDKIEKAVLEIVPFITEMEEFTLLNRDQVQTLIENTLSASGIFNQQLCDDTATLFFRTNMKVSRDKIVKEWKSIARSAENSILAENVMILSESKNFENAYDRFLHLIFEAISNRDVTAESLATTLEVLKDKTPKIKESHELSSKLMGLIERLKAPDFDDSAIYEAEDLIATIQEELSASESLRDFDSMPGDSSGPEPEPEPAPEMDFGKDAIKTGNGSQPIININSPLIQIGGTSGAPEDGDDDMGDLGDLDMDVEPEAAPEEDDEFGDLLGSDEDEFGDMGAQAPAAPAPAQAQAPAAAPRPPGPGGPPRVESRRRSGNAFTESRPDGSVSMLYKLIVNVLMDKDELRERIRYLRDMGAANASDSFDYEELNHIMSNGPDAIKAMDQDRKKSLWLDPVALYQLSEMIDEEMPDAWMDELNNSAKQHWDTRHERRDIEESGDPYSYRNRSVKPNVMMDYGSPAIKDQADLDKVVRLMKRLANEHKLNGRALAENLDDMARASIEAIGLRLPTVKLETAVEQAVGLFLESSKPFPGAAAPFGKKKDSKHDHESDESDESDEDSEDDKPWEEEGVAEDQYKSPRYSKPGYGRSTISPTKKVRSESRITWIEQQDDAMMGRINGVNFILDHGVDSSRNSNNPLQPVIMSEDGHSSEIPIPSRLVASALASAGLAKGSPQAFERWLSESVEQLRGISNYEDSAINEAMATIRTKPDGSLEVELQGDVDVDMDDDMNDMKPVDSVDITPVDNAADIKSKLDDDDDSMPDFDKIGGGDDDDGDDEMPEPSDDDEDFDDEDDTEDEDESEDDLEDESEEDEEDEDGIAEDMDISAPSDAKYGKLAKDNKRTFPKHDMPKKKSGDKLEGLGPDLKKDSGSGSNPPFSRKGGSR
jgi:hypothetical protein